MLGVFFSPWMRKVELVFIVYCGHGCADTHPAFIFNGNTTDLGIKYQIFLYKGQIVQIVDWGWAGVLRIIGV